MSVILKYDRKKYIPKEELRIKRKYGQAIYLPRNGDGITDLFKTISNAILNNKETIKSLADVGSNITSTVGNVANTTINTLKNIEELKALKRKGAIIPEKEIEEISEKHEGGSFFKI